MSLHRAPLLTMANLDTLRHMVRVQWIHAAQRDLIKVMETAEGGTVVDLVATFINVTDSFDVLRTAIDVWTFQMKVSGLNQMQVIMSERLHDHFVKLAEANYGDGMSDTTVLTDETRAVFTKVLEDQPKVLKVLREAESLDPEALAKAKTPLSGKPPQMLN